MANSWAVDKVRNLERGGSLERGKPTFSLVILWRATKSQLRLALVKAHERKALSGVPAERETSLGRETHEGRCPDAVTSCIGKRTLAGSKTLKWGLRTNHKRVRALERAYGSAGGSRP
jgi:hypothetical protein